MASVFPYILSALATLLAIPVTIFVIEIVAALVVPARAEAQIGVRRRVAILVPAHNESLGIRRTLEDLKTQLLPGDRLLVVADNCIDDTAAVALATGAEIIERSEPTRIGKGYALDFGVKHISLDPPATIIIIDADCRVAEGTIDRLATTSEMTSRPVQALDLMIAEDKSPINYRIAEFAWRIKNWVRPLGLRALNLPCQLMGTGMAFPWEVIYSAHLATGSIVEDIKIGLEVTLAGHPPIFCPSAVVTSRFPSSVGGAEAQRKRWEGGHVKMVLTMLPRLIYEAVVRRNINLLVLALDLAVLPLSLLILLLAGINFVAWIALLCGVYSTALMVSGICIIALVLAVVLAWVKYGRDVLALAALPSVFSYIFAKLPFYRQLLSGGPASSWTRADREKSE